MFLVDFRRFYQRWNSLNYNQSMLNSCMKWTFLCCIILTAFEKYIYFTIYDIAENIQIRVESLFFNINAHLFHVNTVSTTCTNPNLVLIFATFTFASPDSENTLTLLVSGFFEIVTNSPPRVSSWKKREIMIVNFLL